VRQQQRDEARPPHLACPLSPARTAA
jgi:hypothetical protein